MTEDDRPTGPPVLVENLRAICRGDRAHAPPPSALEFCQACRPGNTLACVRVVRRHRTLTTTQRGRTPTTRTTAAGRSAGPTSAKTLFSWNPDPGRLTTLGPETRARSQNGSFENPEIGARFHDITAGCGDMYAGFDSMKAGSMRLLLPPVSNTLQHTLPDAANGGACWRAEQND